MIVQACLNGARRLDYHRALPIDAEAIARDGANCVAAGAAELHFHPRRADGRESLDAAAMDAAVLAARRACPGTTFGVSTGAWIENDERRTLAAIDSWREPPDYASVNLAEPGAPAVIERLHNRGVGVEAGLASVSDAERLIGLDRVKGIVRVLIEIEEQDLGAALVVVDGVAAALASAQWRRPILLHGFDATVWPLAALAAARRWSTRVGLEDGRLLPDGALASGNAALVAAAVAVKRGER